MRSRLTWGGHVEIMGDKNWQTEQILRTWRGIMSGRPAMGDCIKNDLERVGEEWRQRATDRRIWRLLIAVREK